MSPILVRPVREQLEHDRVIRLLQAKYKRKFEVAINPGSVQAVPIGTGPGGAWYPDLVLQSGERGRKLAGVVEVETVESVNHLEAMSQWAALAKARAPFHLYVPVASIDSARRLCVDHAIPVSELWSYSAIGDQMRFALVQRAPQPAAPAARPAPKPETPSRTAKPAERRRPAARPAAKASAGARSGGRAAARGSAAKAAASRRPAARASASKAKTAAKASRVAKRR